jgi:hypothetical protein
MDILVALKQEEIKLQRQLKGGSGSHPCTKRFASRSGQLETRQS